jgi:hypothetical protein
MDVRRQVIVDFTDAFVVAGNDEVHARGPVAKINAEQGLLAAFLRHSHKVELRRGVVDVGQQGVRKPARLVEVKHLFGRANAITERVVRVHAAKVHAMTIYLSTRDNYFIIQRTFDSPKNEAHVRKIHHAP